MGELLPIEIFPLPEECKMISVIEVTVNDVSKQNLAHVPSVNPFIVVKNSLINEYFSWYF